MTEEARLELNKTPLMESENKDSGIHRMLSDAYQWASENKTEVAIGAALVALGGAALVRKALTVGEGALPELAIGNADNLALKDLGTPEANPFSTNAGARFDVLDENSVMFHEVQHPILPLHNVPRELGEADFNEDGSLKILRFMALEPRTGPIFREASALNQKMGGDSWGEALITTFEQRSPGDLPWLKAGLEQIGILPK